MRHVGFEIQVDDCERGQVESGVREHQHPDRSCQLADGLLDFLNVSRDLDLRKNSGDASAAVDDYRRTLDAHELEPIHGFLLPDPERIGEAVPLVGKEPIRETVLLLEFAVRLEAVGTHPNHHRIDFPEPGKGVAKIARLLRSAGRVVFGIEEEHDVFAREGLECHDGPIVGVQGKAGCPIAFTDHRKLREMHDRQAKLPYPLTLAYPLLNADCPGRGRWPGLRNGYRLGGRQ